MATVRDTLIDALVARLRTILIGESVTIHTGDSHTYLTGIGNCVLLRDLSPVDPSDLPRLNVFPGVVRTDDERSEVGRPLRVLPVTLMLMDTAENGDEQINDMLADVLACIGSDPSWSAAARWTTFSVGEPLAEQMSERIYAVPVELEISYRTAHWYAI